MTDPPARPPDNARRDAEQLVDDIRLLWKQLETLLERIETQRALVTEDWATDHDGDIPDHTANILAPREVDVTLVAMLARLATVAPEPESVTADELAAFGINIPGYSAWVVAQATTSLAAIAARTTTPGVHERLAGHLRQLRSLHLRDGR